MKSVYQKIALEAVRLNNIRKELQTIGKGNDKDRYHWEAMAIEAKDRIEKIVREYLPHGSGFNYGVVFISGKSGDRRLVFGVKYDHMVEGMYTEVTEHEVIVESNLAFDIDVDVYGEDADEINEYIGDVFYDCLTEKVED